MRSRARTLERAMSLKDARHLVRERHYRHQLLTSSHSHQVGTQSFRSVCANNMLAWFKLNNSSRACCLFYVQCRLAYHMSVAILPPWATFGALSVHESLKALFIFLFVLLYLLNHLSLQLRHHSRVYVHSKHYR